MSEVDPAASLWQSFDQSWKSTIGLWTAWGEAWRSYLEGRAAPAARALLERAANPAAWPEALAPLRDQLQEVLLLPKLADLPAIDSSPLTALMPTAELVSATQAYIAALMPVWAKLSDRFRRAVAEQRERGGQVDNAGEAFEIWNAVVDRTLMEFHRSSEFGKLQQRFLRASMRHRIEIRNNANRAAAALELPTRPELDDVYQRLHDLRQEVVALRREVRTLKRAAHTEAQP